MLTYRAISGIRDVDKLYTRMKNLNLSEIGSIINNALEILEVSGIYPNSKNA